MSPCMSPFTSLLTCNGSFQLLSGKCGAEFKAQFECLDANSQHYHKCRTTQVPHCEVTWHCFTLMTGRPGHVRL